MKALITGATGFVGRRLCSRLDDFCVLSRDPVRARQTLQIPESSAFAWNPTKESPPLKALQNCDSVFHLAGHPVGETRWNDRIKKKIRESRVLGTRHLVDAISRLEHKPKVLVSASAVGYYGQPPDEDLNESSAAGDDFLAEVCIEWESEARRAEQFGVRVVCVRIGVVLGVGGGAMGKMLPPFKFGLGGTLGNGRQWMPWIHVDDVVGLMLHAAHTNTITGPINGTAPTMTTNRQFTKALGKSMRRPTLFPIPNFVLRTLVGEFAQVMVSSQRVHPRAAIDAGYKFRYPEIQSATDAIVAESA